MAGSAALRSWAVVAAFGVVAVLRGCDPGSATDDERPGGPARGALLESVWPDVVGPSLSAFGDAAEALDPAVGAWAAAPEDVALRASAQTAWRDALAVWHVVEVLQFGPTGSALSVEGGEDYRDAIYSWPTAVPCRVDQEIVAEDFAVDGFVDTELPNVLGLDALEYLLFDEDDGNDCEPIADINAGPWQALDLAELNARRAAYAAVLSADISVQAAALVAVWSPDGGGFATELATAGDGSTIYDTDQAALDDLFGGLFYLELMVKDRKLARPLGLRDCFDPTCPDDIEHRFADFGLEAIAANVAGFRLLFDGGDGDGFDELLAAIDQTSLVEDIEAALDAVDTALALPAGLQDTLTDDPDALLALHDAIKDLTDLLKGDFATLLTLRIPSEAAGDND